MTHGFTDTDEKKYIDALNYVATNAKFENVNTVKGSIELYKHFSFLQSIAKKISDNILEIQKLHTPAEQVEPNKKGKGKAK